LSNKSLPFGTLTWRELARRVWGGINKNDLLNRACELAYNFLLAVFPLLLFLIAVLGAFASEVGRLRSDLFLYLRQILPPSAYHLLLNTIDEIAQHAGGGKATFGLLFALYSGSGGMTQLISTLNAAYEVHEGRSWLKVHVISLGLTVVMAVLGIAELLLVLVSGKFFAFIGQGSRQIILQ
jgi:membrane protein